MLTLYSTFSIFISTLFNTVSEDAGIEPRTVATLGSAVINALTTRLDLIPCFLTTLSKKRKKLRKACPMTLSNS